MFDRDMIESELLRQHLNIKVKGYNSNRRTKKSGDNYQIIEEMMKSIFDSGGRMLHDKYLESKKTGFSVFRSI